jgi:predicted O-linked N-acetylglucosamine transferase (SPINDLY family)
VFARKPAPIQVSWIGYPGTTGLAAVDCLVADRQQVPERDEALYRERILCLEGGYVAYTPPAEAGPVGPLPARSNGWPTFGCFSNAMKLNEPLLGRWCEILRRLPEARLILKYGRLDEPLVEGRLREQFVRHGIDRQRVEILGHTDRAQHLAAYGRVDLALDTFPYSGGVTTCEALWMGVPVIAWPGATFAGRHSLSHLTAAGLPELVARDADHYVDLAVEWATNLERLEALRAGLRQRVTASPLCDGRRVAEQLARHLVEAWRRFCDQAPDSPGGSS